MYSNLVAALHVLIYLTLKVQSTEPFSEKSVTRLRKFQI